MSRTYRIRHLPRITAKKYVDGRTARFREDREELVDSVLRLYFPEAFNEKGRLRWSYFSVRWSLREKIDAENPLSVATKTQHPWVRWSRIATSKAEYKRTGNKCVRRHNRALLRNRGHLGDEVDERDRFFDKKDGWDIWVLF